MRAQRHDIEGLRAVAVLAVLGFHAGVPFFTGGYVGVDVFFVISGFLITGILLSDLTFSLAEFYARRARRILPAAGLVLLVTALASLVVLPPLRQRDVATDVLAAALHVGNWRFIGLQTDYLAAHDPSPLLHYWSLAVEEQFYLLWAPVVALIAYLARRRTRLALGVVLAVGTASSFVLSLYWTGTSAPLAYLSSPSRAWQFGAGALLALLAPRLPVVVRRVLGWAGLAGIGYAVVAFDSHTAFPGTAALVPTLGAVALLASGAGPARLLGLRPLRAIGRLSFSWYLWHWPVLVLAEARLGALSWPVRLALVAASALPAYLTLRLVERPIRYSATISSAPRRGLAIGATAIVLPLFAGLLVGTGAARDLGTEPGPLPALAQFTAVATGAAPAPTGGPVRPTPLAARTDYGSLPGECLVAPAAVSSPPCRFGAVASADRIVLLGDSHAAQWYPAALALAERRGWALEVLTKQGCPLATLTVTNPQLGREYRECDQWRRAALDRVAAGTPPKLILAATLSGYTPDAEALAAGWAATLRPLARTGAPVAYLKDTPHPGRDIPTCVSGALDAWGKCSFPRSAGEGPLPTVHEIEVNDLLCPAERCPAVIAGVLLYRDDSHLTNTVAALLAPRVEQLLTARGLLPSTGWTEVFSSLAPGDWKAELGTDWGTGEIETTTDSPRNVSHADGRIAITPQLDAGNWTSGRISTSRSDFAAPAGGTLRVEASIQLPQVGPADGLGYWPAFWLLGAPIRTGADTWPSAGEIDVLEAVNGRPSIFGTLHCAACAEPVGLSSGDHACDCGKGYHSYAIELDARELRWYLDGVLYHRVTAEQVGAEAWRRATGHGFYVILDVAVGGALPKAAGGGPSAATVPGRPMLVRSLTVSTRA